MTFAVQTRKAKQTLIAYRDLIHFQAGLLPVSVRRRLRRRQEHLLPGHPWQRWVSGRRGAVLGRRRLPGVAHLRPQQLLVGPPRVVLQGEVRRVLLRGPVHLLRAQRRPAVRRGRGRLHGRRRMPGVHGLRGRRVHLGRRRGLLQGEVRTPTNTASVHLVAMGCPNARAGVKIVKKKNLYSNLEQPKF